jgi:four helix bundle protein
VQNFRKLLVWQKAHALAVRVKEVTEPIGRRESTGVVLQARRAALSIASNIAEGCNRLTDRDFAKFLQIAIASASELEYQLQYAGDTRILKRRDVEQLLGNVVEVRRMLFGLLKRLRDDDDKRQTER